MTESKANCLISIAGYGAVRVNATRVAHGMTVVSYSGAGESRHGSTFYSSKRVSGSFEVTIHFATYHGYELVSYWLRRYMIWAGNPRAFAAPVRVQIPSRNFDKFGALEKGPTFGDKVGATSYSCELELVGARDPLEMGGNVISQFHLPKDPDVSAPFFYPAGVQLTGDHNAWDTAYNPDDELPSLPDIPIDIPPLF